MELNVGGLASPMMDMFNSIMRTMLYLVPILFILGLTIIAYFYLIKRKRFDIDALIITETANNKVIGYDKAGIIKNLAGGDSMALRIRKRTFPIPDRSFWILNEKGKFTIPFYKYGEDDYAPTRIEILDSENITKKSLKEKVISKLKEIKGIDLKKFQESDEYQAIDIKRALKDVKLIPIPSDIKTHLKLSTKESILKWHKVKPYEKLLTLAPYAMAVLLIFLTMFYGYKFAETQISNGYAESQICRKASEDMLLLIQDKFTAAAAPIRNPNLVPIPPI